MFYPRRVLDINDGKPKWSGISDSSELIADSPMEAIKKRKRQEEKEEGEQAKKGQEKEKQNHPGDNEAG